MRNIKWDVVILLNIGLLLFGSVSMLHKHISAKQDQTATPETVNALLQPLLYARSIDTLARAMLQFPADVIYKVLPKMITDEDSPLNDDDKALLLIAVAYYLYKSYKVDPAKIFVLLVEYRKVFEKSPLFFALARTNYAPIISQILAYERNLTKGQPTKELFDLGKQVKSLFAMWQRKSLEKAVEVNDPQAYEAMDQYGIVPDKKMVNYLLFRVVKEDKSQEFIRILKTQGANLDYYDTASGRSLLMVATSESNAAMAQALLKAGANPNFMPSSEIGSPLQYAFEQGQVEIEELLREYGGNS